MALIYKDGSLSTTTTTGDILYRANSSALARLAIGSTGQVLTVASGIPAWSTDTEAYLPSVGGTMSGPIAMGGNNISGGGTITGTFVGGITGNVTGNTSGSSGSTTGNAATATTLATARNINGVSFNGSAAITVTSAAGTLSGSTLASGVTASSLTSVSTLTSLTVTGDTTVNNGNVEIFNAKALWLYSTATTSNYELFSLDKPDAGNARLRVYKSGSGTDRGMEFHTGGSERMRILSTGNVGIGTESPYTKLVINHGGAAQAPLNAAWASTEGVGWYGNDGILELFSRDDNTTWGHSLSFKRYKDSDGALISGFAFGTWTNTGNQNSNTFNRISLTHGSDPYAQNNTEIMSWLPSGRVGIGATNPASLLHVSDTGTASVDDQVRFFRPALASGNYYSIGFGRAEASGESAFLEYHYNSTIANSFVGIGNYGDSVDNGVGLVVRKGGNVGIGQTAPASSHGFSPGLELRGEPFLRFEESGGSTGYEFVMNSGTDKLRLISTTAGADVFNITPTAATFAGHVYPSGDGAKDLGASDKQWRNIYTADFHLNNTSREEGNEVDGTKGNWTIQEGRNDLYLLNNETGKQYKFNLTEIE